MAYIGYLDHEQGGEKHYRIPDDRMIIFGREDHTDFQILQDSQISREHFSIKKGNDGRFTLIDLGSANGTFLNGRQVESNGMRWLKHGDVIRVGRQQFAFRNKIEPPPPEPAGSGNPVKDVLRDLQKGKGFHTIMQEIVGQGVKKPKPPSS